MSSSKVRSSAVNAAQPYAGRAVCPLDGVKGRELDHAF